MHSCATSSHGCVSRSRSRSEVDRSLRDRIHCGARPDSGHGVTGLLHVPRCRAGPALLLRGMALEKITQVSGTAVYIPGSDIDTDRIIPARFMKCVTFDGLG